MQGLARNSSRRAYRNKDVGARRTEHLGLFLVEKHKRIKHFLFGQIFARNQHWNRK